MFNQHYAENRPTSLLDDEKRIKLLISTCAALIYVKDCNYRHACRMAEEIEIDTRRNTLSINDK